MMPCRCSLLSLVAVVVGVGFDRETESGGRTRHEGIVHLLIPWSANRTSFVNRGYAVSCLRMDGPGRDAFVVSWVLLGGALLRGGGGGGGGGGGPGGGRPGRAAPAAGG